MASAGFHLKLDLSSTFGAYTIGTFISAILLGVTVNQTYRYFNKYSDPLIIKLTVASLLLLEMLHSAFSMHAVYYYVVANYGNPFALLESVWSANINFGIIGLNVLFVHWSYALRLYYVSGKKVILPSLLGVVSICHALLGWYLTALLFKEKLLVNIPGRPETIAKVILSVAVGIDVTIAISLSLYLHKSRTGFKRTDKLINKLVIYTMNNGLLTSATDIVALVFVFTEPHNLIFLAITQVIGNLYTNSLMALLNSRYSLKSTGGDSSLIQTSSFGVSPSTGDSNTEASSFSRTPINASTSQKFGFRFSLPQTLGKEGWEKGGVDKNTSQV